MYETHPTQRLHPRLIALGAALLIAAFVTDLFYWRTLLFQWSNFSIWLLTGGLILAGLSGLALAFDVARRRVARLDRTRFVGLTAAALLSLLNAFIHSRDAYTSIAPEGLMLSAIVTVLLIAVGWRGWDLAAPEGPHSAQEAHP